MANEFNKEETVAWEQMLEGFEDAMVLSKNVSLYNTNATDMERQSDIIWRPMPYVAQSFDGTDMTSNFKNVTQLSVPATIGFEKSSPWMMTANELRDALQEGRIYDSAKQKLASDINTAVMNVASQQGTLVVKRTTAAAGFDDVAQCDAIMTEQGVQDFERYLALSTRDYNGMASNLAARSTMTGKPTTAYEKAYVGMVSSFETFKMAAQRLTLAAGVTVTVNGDQYYTPAAKSTAATGEVSNVDNRYMNLAITVSSGTVKVGDCFTISASNAINAVHQINKQNTGQLKTFRITAIVSGAGGTGTVQISPPIIAGSAGGGTDAELQYQNCSDKAVSGATITFLNTVTAYANPFWQKDAIELLPGSFVIPEGSGVSILKGSTEQGISLCLQKFYDIKVKKIMFRVDTRFGVCMKQPEMAGLMLFSQT